MNEQLQSKLVEILGSIQNAAKASGDFAMEQLPDIAQQYILYGQVMSIIYVFFSALVLLFGLWMARHVIAHVRKHEDLNYCDPGIMIGGGFLSFLLCLIGILSLVDFIGRAVLVWGAPKVWLLMELSRLLK